jgi:hypothetical protein
MSFDKSVYKKVTYGAKEIHFHSGYSFHNHFGHKRKIRQFPFHQTLLEFLDNNPEAKIYFTHEESVENFNKYDNDFVININAYLKFCRSLSSSTKGRARAFLGQHLKIADILASEDEKAEFIRKNATESQLLAAIRQLDDPTQKRIMQALRTSTSTDGIPTDVGKDDFIQSFTKFIVDEEVQAKFFNSMPNFQIETLQKHMSFIEVNLDKNEAFFQNWIDEEEGKYRKQRCLIFGVEYIDPKREGVLTGKKFDILAEQNRESHIIIELKSPSAEIFKINPSITNNGGVITEYNLSPALSRAIPQILGYKKWYEHARAEELQAMGINSKKTISKCIIVIGTRKEDPVWKENFNYLKESLNIELWTYTDLIDKLQNTIINLRESS